jgi:hypothetical protein
MSNLPANAEANAAIATMILRAMGADKEMYGLIRKRLEEVYPDDPLSVASVLWSAFIECEEGNGMGPTSHRKLVAEELLMLIKAPAAVVADAEEEEEEEDEEEA